MMSTPKKQQYHAAFVPWEVRKSYTPFCPNDFVSTERQAILDLIKSGMKNSKAYRFKTFATFEEALAFVTDDSIDKPKMKVGDSGAELALPFPSIEIYEISAFKRCIESRNYEAVEIYVKRNPRFLISYNADSPTILKTGPRYNSVHVAIRAKAAEILKFILASIESIEFIRKAYPDSDEELIEEKRVHLLDLYLNTPDKVNFNTPLHFACENGSLDCLNVLLTYCPRCDTSKRNKRNLMPIEVIKNLDLKPKIELLFQSCHYVSITRNEESFKVLEPLYGRPSLNSSFQIDHDSRITAIAGPMSPENARIVFDQLKSPQKNSPKQRSLRCSDFQRGLEKVAKEVCFEINVPIEEYWEFMGQYANFGTEEGLVKLNNYMSKINNDEKFDHAVNLLKNLSLKLDRLSEKLQLEGGDESIHNQYEDSDDESVYYTAQSSPEPLDQVVNFIGGQQPNRTDHDVLAELEAALQDNRIYMTCLQEKHPFVFNWYQAVKKYIRAAQT